MIFLLLFVASAVVHLVALATDLTWLAFVTKVVLVPSLAAWVYRRRGPHLVVAALVLCGVGDILLEFFFIGGMAFFAAAHVCYVTFFVRSGALSRLRGRWLLPLVYVLAYGTLIVLLWSGLGVLQIPVALYAVLLTGTAATSAGFTLRTGLGGALFFISDGLISLRLADLPQPPMPSLWIMSTYIAAQYLLASGVLRAQRAASPAPQAAPAVV